jgi:hypothetical protein
MANDRRRDLFEDTLQNKKNCVVREYSESQLSSYMNEVEIYSATCFDSRTKIHRLAVRCKGKIVHF